MKRLFNSTRGKKNNLARINSSRVAAALRKQRTAGASDSSAERTSRGRSREPESQRAMSLASLRSDPPSVQVVEALRIASPKNAGRKVRVLRTPAEDAAVLVVTRAAVVFQARTVQHRVEGIESAHKDAIAAMAALGTVAEDQHTTTKGRIRRAMLAVLYGALLEDLSAELMLVTQRPVASVCLAARMRAARVLLPMYNGPDWEAGHCSEPALAKLLLKWDAKFREHGTLESLRPPPKDVLRSHELLRSRGTRLALQQFIRVKLACRRTDPSWELFTSRVFVKHVQDKYDTTISPKTARKWIGALGFDVDPRSPGQFVDGHERTDVQLARETYVQYRVENYDRLVRTEAGLDVVKRWAKDADHVFTDEEQVEGGFKLKVVDGRQQRPLIELWHDESTFYSKDVRVTQMYRERGVGKTPAFKKSTDLGASLMVSAFFAECIGCVHGQVHDRTSAAAKGRAEDEAGAGTGTGYWTSAHMQKQVNALLTSTVLKDLLCCDIEVGR